MKLNKENFCVYIENEAQLQQARELLLKHNEKIDKDIPFTFEGWLRWLKFYKANSSWYIGLRQKHFSTEVTLSELEEILKHEL